MKTSAKLTRYTGLAALMFLIMALNFALLLESPFKTIVLVPAFLGLLTGGVWTVSSVTRMASGADRGKTIYAINAVIASLLFFAICVTLYAFARHPRASWDLTREGRRNLSAQTIQVLEALVKDVEVHGLFVTSADSESAVSRDKTRRFLEQCQTHTNKLKVTFTDPERDQLVLKRLDVKRVSKQGTIVIQCESRKREIPLSGVTARLEERDFVNALINLVRESSPKVYFMTGHGEKSIDDTDPKDGASSLKTVLEGESYKPEILVMTPQNAQIPADCDILVLNGQVRDLHPKELGALEDYVRRGGRVMVLFDLWAVKREADGQTIEQLRPWLAKYGVSVGEDIVISDDNKAEVYLVPDYGMMNMDGKTRGSYNGNHAITRGLDGGMVFSGARSITVSKDKPTGTTAEELLWSLPNCWAETNLDLLFNSANPQAKRDDNEPQGAIPMAAAVTVKTDVKIGDTGQTKDARVVVIGSREFASNEKLIVLGHINFIMNAFAWLSETEDLIGIRASAQENDPVILTPADEKTISWVASLGVLQAVVIAGAVMYHVRRRRQ